VEKLPIVTVTQLLKIRPVMSQSVSHNTGSCSSTDHSIWHSWS